MLRDVEVRLKQYYTVEAVEDVSVTGSCVTVASLAIQVVQEHK